MRRQVNFFIIVSFIITAVLALPELAQAREDYFKPAIGEVLPAETGLERAVTGNEGGLNLFLETGELAPGFPLFINNEVIISSPLFIDLEGNTAKEIVFVTRNTSGAYKLYAYKGDATLLASHSFTTGTNTMYYDPAEQPTYSYVKPKIVIANKLGALISLTYENGAFTAETIINKSEPLGVTFNANGNEMAVNYPQGNVVEIYKRNEVNGVTTWNLSSSIPVVSPILYPVTYERNKKNWPAVKLYGVDARNYLVALESNAGWSVQLPSIPLDSPVISGNELFVPLITGRTLTVDSQGNIRNQKFIERSVKESNGIAHDRTQGGIFTSIYNTALAVYTPISKKIVSLFGSSRFTPQSLPELYEDAEDGDTDGWFVAPSSSPATLSNVADDATHGKVIALDDKGTVARMVYYPEANHPWAFPIMPILQWEAKYADDTEFLIYLDTNEGVRYLSYSTTAGTTRIDNNIFRFAIDQSYKDGNWHTFSRNLQQDVAALSPNTVVLGVRYFSAFGTGKVDNIQMFRAAPLATISGQVMDAQSAGVPGINITALPYGIVVTTDSTGIYRLPGVPPGIYTLTGRGSGYSLSSAFITIDSNGTNITQNLTASSVSSIMYEDGSDGDTAPWFINPDGASGIIQNVTDEDPSHGPVIELSGASAGTRMVFYTPQNNPWVSSVGYPVLQLDMKYNNEARVLIMLKTNNTALNNGHQYLSYGTADTPGLQNYTVSYRLDSAMADGSWHTLTRNLQKDLEAYLPGTTIESIQYFSIYGNGRLDNLKLNVAIPLATVSGTVTDQSNNPIPAATVSAPMPIGISVFTDSAGKYVLPGVPPGDYTLTFNRTGFVFPNIAITVDGAGADLTVNVAASSVLSSIMYEDGSDGDTAPWFINPTGATGIIQNIADDDPVHGQVIELSNAEPATRIVFYAPATNPWAFPSTHPVMQWDMKYSGKANVLIMLKTNNTALNDGYQYLSYSTDNTPGLVNHIVYYRLDSAMADGSWHTLTQNLQKDLEAYLPGTVIENIQYFSIYGNGRLDNLAMLKEMP